MRIAFPIRRAFRWFYVLAVWFGAAGLAFLLYRQSNAGVVAVAIAQSKQYRIAASQLGRVSQLDVMEGQRVGPGEIIARLDTDLMENQLSVAEAEVRHASSEITAAGATFDTALLQVERNFQTEVDSAQVDLQNAQAEHSRDRVELDKLLEELRREQDFLARGLIKSDRLIPLNLRRAALEEVVRTWPSRVAALQSRLTAAQARLADWRRAHAQAEGGSRTAQLAPIQEKVDARKAAVRVLRTRMRQTVLRAATHAYVSIVHARNGDVLKPGDPVVTLVEVQPRQVIAYLDERRGSLIATGSHVVARRRTGLREQFSGTVSAVSAEVAQLPRRVWTNPNIPLWGRAVYIDLPDQATVDPGEMLDVATPETAVHPVTQMIAAWRGMPQPSN